MEIKIQLGKLHFATPLADMIAEQQHTNGLEILSITLDHALAIATLPLVHKDPFDRLLVAQAKVEEMTFISRDKLLTAYPIAVEW
jgi:PIN domain nuclease of toxin-antitoxin system